MIVRYTRAKVGHRQDPFLNLTPLLLASRGVLLCVAMFQKRHRLSVRLSSQFVSDIAVNAGL
jgi:hypothetical protein